MDTLGDSLTASVPQIMITAASPLKPSPCHSQTSNKTYVVTPVESPKAAAPAPTSAEAPVQEDVPQKDAASPDISVPVGVATAYDVGPVANGQAEVLAVEPPAAADAPLPAADAPRWCPSYGGLVGYYQHYSERLVESKYLLPLQFLLLALPISSGFMAAQYMDECPLSPATPILMFMMGIVGTIVILCRMLLIIRKALLPHHPDWWLLRTIIIFGNLTLIMLLATEMLSFLRASPSDRRGDPNYCHPTFYSFSFWMNWAALALVLVVAFVHAPSCTTDSVSTTYPLPL